MDLHAWHSVKIASNLAIEPMIYPSLQELLANNKV